eukprot:3933899-Rhodomonas_salina.1
MMTGSSRKRESDLPTMKGTRVSDWDKYERELKIWAWNYGNKSSWVIKDGYAATFFAPDVSTLDGVREAMVHQMTIFSALQHARLSMTNTGKHSEISKLTWLQMPLSEGQLLM